MSFPTYNFSPTAISGCFAWYNARSLNLTNGSSFTRLNDLSGSGNNLIFGTGIFYTGMTPNGGPAISFTNGNYMWCSGNLSFINSPSDITMFAVFKTNNTTTNQPLVMYEDSSIHHTYYGMSIGQNTGPSGWEGWYSDTFGQESISSTQIPYASGEWIIRTDRNKQGEYVFYKNSTPRDSGVLSSSYMGPANSTTEKFNLAGSLCLNTLFDGMFAEVIMYGRSLEDGEASAVETYLKYQHYINGNACTLYIGSFNAASGSVFPLFVNSYNHPSISGQTTLYIFNGIPGGATGFGSFNSYGFNRGKFDGAFSSQVVSGPSGIPSQMFLYINSSDNPINSMPLYMQGPPSQTGIFNITPLYVCNNVSIQQSGCKLFIQGPAGTNGANVLSNGMNLYTTSPTNIQMATLFLQANMPTLSTTIYMSGQNIWNNSTSLVVNGTATSGYNSIPLYIQPTLNIMSGVSLTISGIPTLTNSIPIYTNGF